MPAIGTNVVGEVFIAAVRAGDQMPWPERIVRTAPIATTF
jgi:hypothetical protein